MLVLLVAVPRLTALNGYLIIDEADRWRWAEAFYRALIAGDLHGMLVGDGYPGIVPAWLETIWLLGESLRRSLVEGRWIGDDGVYMLLHVWSRTTHLAWQRLPIVLFNGLLALTVAWQAGKAYGRRVGVVALVLIALNPFYLADSRVNRAEAIITGLLTLSVLFLVRFGQTRRHRFLIASGVMGGLGFLTKIQGLVVLPAVAAILLLSEQYRHSRLLSRLVNASLLLAQWVLITVLVWVALWPAMWVRPLDVLGLVFEYATMKTGSEGVNLFFAGRHFFHEDPGLLFYPVVALLRMTPMTMGGLMLALWAGVRKLRSRGAFSRELVKSPIVPLLVYIMIYVGIMTVGGHKQDRYLMPISLTLDIIAAMGWVYLWAWLGKRWSSFRGSGWTLAALGSLVAVQLVTVVPHHPYYFPYFNQVMGGGAAGVRLLRVGWGEGMDQVAEYLNAKPDAANLKVAARWYRYMVGFSGQTLPFDESGQWARADVIVLYVQQTQRMFDPSPGIIRYFQNREPEHVVRISGIEYAQIYPSPFTRPAQPSVSEIPDQAALFGYRWENGETTDRYTVPQLRVVWENHNLTDEPVSLMVALTDGSTLPDWQPCPVAYYFEEAARTQGEVAESECDLSVLVARLPTGVYDVQFGLTGSDSAVTEFVFPEGWQSVVREEDGTWRPADWVESLDHIAWRQIPPGAAPADIYYQGQIRLVAYDLSDMALQPGQPLDITLYWQAIEPVANDYIVFNHLFGLDGMDLGMADEAPSVPTSGWLPGQIITTTHRIRTDAVLPAPAVATLNIGLYASDAERKALAATDRRGNPVSVTVGRVRFVPATRPNQLPAVEDDILFGTGLLLRGHTLFETDTIPDRQVLVRLWWQALSSVDEDYAVFVHLLDEAGTIVAQADGIPVEGRYPTSAWGVGEEIVDSHLMTLSSDLPGGRYRLVAGLYHPDDGSRLPLAAGQGDSVVLGEITVAR